MTAVHRVTLLIVDTDDLGPAGVSSVLENARYPNHCIAPSVMAVETREVEWSDEHPLNNSTTMREAFAELFGDLKVENERLRAACRRVCQESDWCPVCEQHPSSGHHKTCPLAPGVQP